jgi:methylglutaconyl-CoA hydratase
VKLSDYKNISLTVTDGIAAVTLNRPDIKNAFNDDMIQELIQCYKKLGTSDSVRVVTLTGEGTAFCAGADLHWMGKMVDYSFEENLDDAREVSRLMETIFDCPKPTIALVNGPAIGGGTGLAAANDIVIASDKALFSLSEVKLGIVPACISPYVIRRMGEKNAREYFITGDRIDAALAEKTGLANYSVDSGDLQSKANEIIRKILSSGPNAITVCKELLNKVPTMELKEAGEYTARVIAEIRITDEAQEGIRAFLNKRKPSWRADS